MGDGSTVRNRITLTAIRDKDGKTVKAVGMVENVSYSEVGSMVDHEGIGENGNERKGE